MKSKDNLERVPPFIPIIWQDWDSSVDVQNMTASEEGIYFRLIRKLWVLDELPADSRRLSQLIRVPDERTMERWLEKHGHLLSLNKKHSRECTGILREVYGTLPVDYRETTCKCPGTFRSEKLRILKNNAKTNMPLGYNQTKPNLNQTKPMLVSQLVSYEEAEASSQNQGEEVEFEVLDTEVEVHDLSCFTLLHEEFGRSERLPEETIRRVHSALKMLDRNEAWMQGCIQFALAHKKFWATRVFDAKTFADALVNGINDPNGKKLPAQYDRYVAQKRRAAGAGKR